MLLLLLLFGMLLLLLLAVVEETFWFWFEEEAEDRLPRDLPLIVQLLIESWCFCFLGAHLFANSTHKQINRNLRYAKTYEQ
jgi:hypothetical protein